MKIFLILTFLFAATSSPAQVVEKSLFNIQTGLLGVWGNHEARLADTFVLRSEIGIQAGFYVGPSDDAIYAGPTIALEPRWYYNIAKRADKGKNTVGNSANMIAVAIMYVPDWFTLTNNDNINIAEQAGVSARWGLRRHPGKSDFNYEFAAGIGYYKSFLKQYGIRQNDNAFYPDLQLRIGYTIR